MRGINIRTSARVCAKNAGGGGLCARGGVFAGHYGIHKTTVASFAGHSTGLET